VVSADDRSARQLVTLAEVSAELRRAGVDHWLGGGWAIDFHAGRISREHCDVDLVVAVRQRDVLARVLTGVGFAPRASDVPDAVQIFVRGDVSVEVTFIVEGPDGTVVTPGYEDWPWLAGAFDGGEVEFGGLRIHAVAPAALLDTKVGWADHVGEEPRPHDLSDIEVLRRHLADNPAKTCG
jgi:Aminoglycoside-2''-adenylyltransferase